MNTRKLVYAADIKVPVHMSLKIVQKEEEASSRTIELRHSARHCSVSRRYFSTSKLVPRTVRSTLLMQATVSAFQKSTIASFRAMIKLSSRTLSGGHSDRIA